MIGRICNLQLLLGLATAIFLGSDFRGKHDHILLSQFWDYPYLVGQIPVFISHRNRVVQLYIRAEISLYIASYDSKGNGGGILTRLQTDCPEQVIVKVVLRSTACLPVCPDIRPPSGPSQRCHSYVKVPQDSLPYLTVLFRLSSLFVAGLRRR
jgi:hypothetical protein